MENEQKYIDVLMKRVQWRVEDIPTIAGDAATAILTVVPIIRDTFPQESITLLESFSRAFEPWLDEAIAESEAEQFAEEKEWAEEYRKEEERKVLCLVKVRSLYKNCSYPVRQPGRAATDSCRRLADTAVNGIGVNELSGFYRCPLHEGLMPDGTKGFVTDEIAYKFDKMNLPRTVIRVLEPRD